MEISSTNFVFLKVFNSKLITKINHHSLDKEDWSESCVRDFWFLLDKMLLLMKMKESQTMRLEVGSWIAPNHLLIEKMTMTS